MPARRTFLKLAAAGLALGAPRLALAAPAWDRRLVLIELQGGNDGLNTVVPFADPEYRRLRPALGLPEPDVVKLDSRLGLHPALAPLLPAWSAEEMAIVLGAGYDKPNRSHFRSIEIWDAASSADEVIAEGWIARLFERARPPDDFAAHAVVFGRPHLGPVGGARARVVLMDDALNFARRGVALAALAERKDNPALAHLARVQSTARVAAERVLADLDRAGKPASTFPRTPIGRQLGQVAQLVAAGSKVAAFKVAHEGYDTHGGQLATHQRLLGELADALIAFRAAMIASGDWRKVLVLTYSEFGRRPKENASAGTDHGTAAPHFALGGAVKGGIVGAQPALDRLVEQDMVHTLDYRRLFATVAKGWWGIPAGGGLENYAPLPLLRT